MSTKLPTYFIGHAGVAALFFENQKPLHAGFRAIGKEIKALNPDAIVITSGHFQSPNDVIQVNLQEPTKVWHDFAVDWHPTYPHVYEYDYPHQSSRALGEKVLRHLKDQGIQAEPVYRDLDHGVWVPFKLMFPEGEDELEIPILEVSTYDGDDYQKHLRLGEALASLGERILIIGSGMLVHNLDAMRNKSDVIEVAQSIEAETVHALASRTPEERTKRLLQLQQRDDWQRAHPTDEHILPLYITLGVGRDLEGHRVWNTDQCTIGQSFTCFRLGNII
ncbi:hypothetical protein ASPZODRAFT_20668 [Penicilliopsis zonata CBS 506.65]|uniref:Extradiol ring-cleavage dioxygenase class III enzyme subunit B domain-containing protein n=1 Tax=Penicilliopsis zonata CBS 506.65 TaxID=1073090 RepID=A0A1L9S4Y5_9EURO|nr:hypothetical protein ASPZODRAFT_20668 [Penicilliopsis zonata CBS 506.65]OJJ42214.1 hypothetical protein ASPZODRAFT_20668 [Penicilliopsis zonata CBS 506.65]